MIKSNVPIDSTSLYVHLDKFENFTSIRNIPELVDIIFKPLPIGHQIVLSG